MTDLEVNQSAELDELLIERLKLVESVTDSVVSLAPSPWPEEITKFFDPNGTIKNIPEFLHESFGVFTLRLYNLQPDFLYTKISIVSVGKILITVKNEAFYGMQFSRVHREMIQHLSDLHANTAVNNAKIRRGDA